MHDFNPIRLTRRQWLRDAAAAGLSLSLGKPAFSAFHRQAIPEPADRKIIVFSKQLEWIDDYDRLCAVVAEIGFDGLELTVRPDGHVLPERVEEDLPDAAEAAARAGIEITMITTNITDPRDDFAERILETAGRLGIATYRMGGLSYHDSKSIDESLSEYKALFRELADMNRHFGIYGVYQNHAGSSRVSASVWDLWVLLKDLDPTWIGCQYDTRHSQLEGGSWWPIGLRLIHDYVRTTVVKDYKWIEGGDGRRIQNCPIGEGVVDLDNYFALVKQLDIRGPISLHFPYPLFEDPETLRVGEREKKTIEVMRQKGLLPIQSMLREAGLS